MGLKIFEVNPNTSNINKKDIIISNLLLKLDAKNKIKISKDYITRYQEIDNWVYDKKPSEIRANFLRYADNKWMPLEKHVVYSIAIYPLILADSPFVHFFEFHPSEINSLYTY
jgi:hypothetical protein